MSLEFKINYTILILLLLVLKFRSDNEHHVNTDEELYSRKGEQSYCTHIKPKFD